LGKNDWRKMEMLGSKQENQFGTSGGFQVKNKGESLNS